MKDRSKRKSYPARWVKDLTTARRHPPRIPQILYRHDRDAGSAARDGPRDGRGNLQGATAIGDLALLSGMHRLYRIYHTFAFADAGKSDLRSHLSRLPPYAAGRLRRGRRTGPCIRR